MLFRALVGDDGVGRETGLAGGELVQLLDVADRRTEIFLRWRPLVFRRGLFIPCEVLGVDDPRGSEVCLHLHDHLGLADGNFASAASLWHSSCFLKYTSIGQLRSGGASNSLLFFMRNVSSIFA